ncbi:SdrD B-like domain-containing protein [Georgenia sp. MJ173]|uniref:SdrD B-like domain-containing protein n=1 Tax=Georgenia sunbinii TaxID=3117728 RepID=UPI002F263E88
MLPKVSVGDYVWVDSDRDGIQDEGEPGIPGVTLVLTGPDGEPVTDVFGNLVEATVTDENGEYTFENLPVLEDGESYTVSIDREASAEPLAPYLPTIAEQGDREGDSSTWTASSIGLTRDGDRDPTLDFGFVVPEGSVSPEEPTTPEQPTTPAPTPTEPEDQLPSSGAEVGGLLAAAAMALLVGLGATMISRRRHTA